MSDENVPVAVDDLTPSKWAAALGISEIIMQRVKTYSEAGWATDGNGASRKLSLPEMKMLAIAEHETGLSAAAGQLLFLGNKLYIPVAGKRAKALKDKDKPLWAVKTDFASADERAAYGVVNNDPKLPKLFEHLIKATLFTRIDGEIIELSTAYGHACVSNIKLRQKEMDPVHSCHDMAETRAISRALSMVYDFFGIDSYEEVALTPIPTNVEIIPEEAPKSLTERLKEKADNITTVPAQVPPPPPVQEQTESGANPPAPENMGAGPADDDSRAVVDTPTQPSPELGVVTVQDVLSFIEEHKAVLPPADLARFTQGKLVRYNPGNLRLAMESLRKALERANSQTEIPSTTEA